jgi:hypothetical protein
MMLVFGTGLYMSWGHTHDLATNNGMTGSHATAYTLFSEVILAISEIVVIFKALMRKKIHWSVYLGMGFGLIITATSNILSLGFLMGISIPIGTAIASLIFASALVETTKTKSKQTDSLHPVEDNPTEVEPALPVIEQKPDEIVEENPAPHSIEPITLEDEKMDELSAEITNENPTEIIEENPVINPTDIQEPATQNTEINPEEIQEENLPENEAEKVVENPTKISKPKRRSTKDSSGKKKSKKSNKKTTTDIPTIIAVAQQLKTAGIFSRAELEKQANTTTHYAKKAIAELEQMEAKNPADIQAKFAVVAGGRN